MVKPLASAVSSFEGSPVGGCHEAAAARHMRISCRGAHGEALEDEEGFRPEGFRSEDCHRV